MIFGGAGYYVYSNRPCAQVTYYKIGTFDPKFGISQADFLADAQVAANLWNIEAGHTVLAYSDTASMPLNLIYDNRQRQTNVGVSIANQENALSAEKDQVAALQSQYDAQRRQYASDQSSGKDITTLNAEAASLNDLAAKIKSRVDALNAKIDAVNANADTYNAQAGSSFEEGEFVSAYGSSRIDLYEFKNNTQLIRLMAHEFGHSLGLDHNANPESIMYPENTATTLVLTAEDKAELSAECTFSLTNLRFTLPTLHL
jgi:predicted Zn-dependent protease